MKYMKITLVIPVYNEEQYIAGCLDSIAKQKIRPDEVIVVDNNCTDNTLLIVKKYPFVQVKHEEKQGMIAARNAGFNAASHEIIARCDADTQLPTNWIKFKRSYSSKIHDTVDCLVMGYDTGKGKRTGFGIGAFLVGVYDEKEEVFKTVSKIGTGLTDEEWREMKARCDKLQINKKPQEYITDKAMEVDMWVRPGIVVEIKADEITQSPSHTALFALRFPRLVRFRNDKSTTDVTTFSEISGLYTKQEA